MSREPRLPFWPQARQRALQARRIRRIVAHAAARVPFYRDALRSAGLVPGDFRSAADLAQLPLVSRAQLAAEIEIFRDTSLREDAVFQLQSSGTSGARKTIVHDRAALLTMFASELRHRRVARRFVGRARPLRIMAAVRESAVGAQLQAFLHDNLWIPPGLAPVRERLTPTAPIDEVVTHINRFRPHVLAGYGSYLGSLFRLAHEAGLELSVPRLVLYGADVMAEADRRLIEEHYGVPVLSTYTSVEELHIAFQCERREGFHVNTDRVALRVVDDDGREVGPGGTGRVIVSNLTNRATVILNYELGDVVTLAAGPCPCGRTLPVIERIAGRSDDLVVLPGGGVAAALAVLAPLQSVPGVVQIQLVQETVHRYVVAVVLSGARRHPDVPGRLHRALAEIVGRDAAIEVRVVDAIEPGPGGKVKAVISRCLPPQNGPR